jgi:SagB-type dehydrogenase family enzyme
MRHSMPGARLARAVTEADSLETVLRYHERTKHHFHRYAAGPRALDWANQPDPFRRYGGAPLLALPLLGANDEPRSPSYDALFARGAVPPAPLSLAALSRLLEYALSLTAWKQAGDVRWALRANPSSGNLHPTEGYVRVALPELGAPGLFHYAPREHALERRAEYALDALAPGAFLVALSSVHWREAWKYGERAFRYCQHDVGHAIGALGFAAAALGWRALLLDGTADESIARLLGLDRTADFADAERESPEALLLISTNGVRSNFPPGEKCDLTPFIWYGAANHLSREQPVPWNIIDVVAEATRKHGDSGREPELRSPPSPDGNCDPGPEFSARETIHRRRSLLACDGRTSISAARLYRMLERTRQPEVLPWRPAIHFALFVHRVDGLEPGL